MLRCTAGVIGILLILWGGRAVFIKIQEYRYPEFLEVLPRFTALGEVGIWSFVLVAVLGGIYLCKFAITGSLRIKK